MVCIALHSIRDIHERCCCFCMALVVMLSLYVSDLIIVCFYKIEWNIKIDISDVDVIRVYIVIGRFLMVFIWLLFGWSY